MNIINKTIIRSVLLALPTLFVATAAQADADKCKSQIEACEKLEQSCSADDQACLDRAFECVANIEKGCLQDPFEDAPEEAPEKPLSPECEAKVNACDALAEKCDGGEDESCFEKSMECYEKIDGACFGEDDKVFDEDLG